MYYISNFDQFYENLISVFSCQGNAMLRKCNVKEMKCNEN